jgi:hypothetical protein
VVGAAGQHRHQPVGRHQYVAQGQIDALPANRRRRVCRVAQQQQPRRSPARQPADDHVEQNGLADHVAVRPQVAGQSWRNLPFWPIDLRIGVCLAVAFGGSSAL